MAMAVSHVLITAGGPGAIRRGAGRAGIRVVIERASSLGRELIRPKKKRATRGREGSRALTREDLESKQQSPQPQATRCEHPDTANSAFMRHLLVKNP